MSTTGDTETLSRNHTLLMQQILYFHAKRSVYIIWNSIWIRSVKLCNAHMDVYGKCLRTFQWYKTLFDDETRRWTLIFKMLDDTFENYAFSNVEAKKAAATFA